MKLLRYRSKAHEVYTLCEMLNKLGFKTTISDSFTLEVDRAVKDFQKHNSLVVDGIVGMKTWQKLFEQSSKILDTNDLFLSEKDLEDFANDFNVELAAVKAVNEVESSGKGFLINKTPKILFEGHIFWRQLQQRGINPNNLLNSANRNVLYSKWTRSFYKGGIREYDRLNQAIAIGIDPKIKEAALASASWGSFQIMGFNAISMGYGTIENFTNSMHIHEREHLKAFGKFLDANNILKYLKQKDWAQFAKRYNGPSYRVNKYDEKLRKAYEKYS